MTLKYFVKIKTQAETKFESEYVLYSADAIGEKIHTEIRTINFMKLLIHPRCKKWLPQEKQGFPFFFFMFAYNFKYIMHTEKDGMNF